MGKVFVVAHDTISAGRAITTYLIGNRVGFREWTDRLEDACHFETRALAKRAANNGERVETVPADQLNAGA